MKKYLTFLKNIDEQKIQLNYPHENFENELNYYLPLINKDELSEFKYSIYKSEKEKL